MSARIEVTYKGKDTRASSKKSWLKFLKLDKKVSEIFFFDVYTIDKDFKNSDLEKIAEILANPVIQKSQVISKQILTSLARQNEPSRPSLLLRNDSSGGFYPKDFQFAVEVSFLPGVTDNVGSTAKEEIEDALKIKFKDDESVYYSQFLIFNGSLSETDAKKIAANLANNLIQKTFIKSFQEFKKDKGMGIKLPKVNLSQKIKVLDVNLNVADKKLKDLGKNGIKENGISKGPLALNLDYMKAIQKYFKNQKRNPTDIELEMLAQTWSEHCKHTIFADPIDDIKEGLFKKYIKGATKKIDHPFCMSVFKDNSGAIEFDENFLITHKVETHNTPSALEPFGGAITGVVGVNRDTIGFGLGAKPIANTYGFMFADPRKEFDLYRSPNKKNPMLSPRRIMEGVVAGINVGGNCSGIPTPQGFVYFDDSYAGKPLVFCGTIGLIPKKVGKRNSWEKKAKKGDYIVMVGGRVGLDGIHGATFSSEKIHEDSPASAVQIGDPITQKKFSDALVKEARDLGLYNSITDNGAGGLSSSIGEMAKESGGCEVWLHKVPLKYPGLEPWQIWISESQERMTLSIPKKNWKKFHELMQNRGVESTVIGEFTSSGKCIVKYGGKVVVNLNLDFLHNGLPKIEQKTKRPTTTVIPSKEGIYKQEILNGSSIKSRMTNSDLNKVILDILKSLNITSFEFISTQYDHTVLSNSVVGPLQGKGRVNGEAFVIKPLLNSNRGLVLSQGYYPDLTDLNPYLMAGNSIDTAVRNVVTAGADPKKIALLDNFCWCSSDEPQRLWQLKEAARGCFDFAVDYKTPFISGKDSMFNDFKGFDKNGKQIKISASLTLLISSLGIIEDVRNAITLDFKTLGDLIYILGELNEDVLDVNAAKNLKLYLDYYKATLENLITSGIAINRGGLAVALAKSSIAGKLGARIKLQNELSNGIELFSESSGRILFTINPKNKNEFEKVMKGNKLGLLGEVNNSNKLKIENNEKQLINIDIEKLSEAYKETFREY